jgi:hypothetical protein
MWRLCCKINSKLLYSGRRKFKNIEDGYVLSASDKPMKNGIEIEKEILSLREATRIEEFREF